MLLCIAGILNREQLAKIRGVLDASSFIDGKATAGYRAKRVKENRQLKGGSDEHKTIVSMVKEALMENREFTTAAWPKRIGGMLVSRYEPGMRYGPHVDAAIMKKGEPLRTDVAMTVFLNDPADYEGGELVIAGASGMQEVKLAAGDAVVYPSSTLHHVAEVTEGVRYVAAGWTQSYVREPAKREVLYDLEKIKRMLADTLPDAPETDLAFKTQSNLLRMWAEN